MGNTKPITAHECNQLLAYEPNTGVVTWKCTRSNKVRLGHVAGSIERDGGRRITIRSHSIPAHHVAFAAMTGRWPSSVVDHINGNRDDNRWENLRLCTFSENSQNRNRPPSNNRSGYIGVSFCSRTGRWRAQIMKQGKAFHLGRFDTVEEAVAARVSAKASLHGEFGKF